MRLGARRCFVCIELTINHLYYYIGWIGSAPRSSHNRVGVAYGMLREEADVCVSGADAIALGCGVASLGSHY